MVNQVKSKTLRVIDLLKYLYNCDPNTEIALNSGSDGPEYLKRVELGYMGYDPVDEYNNENLYLAKNKDSFIDTKEVIILTDWYNCEYPNL